MGATVCAIVFGMRPRSALIRTPNVTDAITIAMVDNMRFIFIDWFIGLWFLLASGEGRSRAIDWESQHRRARALRMPVYAQTAVTE